ncbi:hypothetical protein J31TS4_18410 [Paenibacillus sp. J31TS4]|nr:hypothetical protein J31TS4_18410 [Paenibacillus sp. J31TS4]
MKKSRNAKDFIDSLIPLGMMMGCAAGVLIGIFLEPGFLVFTISIGAGVGCLSGTVAYGICSKQEKY